MLLVYESIDLFGPTLRLRSGDLRFAADDEEADNAYILHSLGAHSISLRPIANALFRTGGNDANAQTTRVYAKADTAVLIQPFSSEHKESNKLQHRGSTIAGLALISDAYLGVAAVFLTRQHQVIAVNIARQHNFGPDSSETLKPFESNGKQSATLAVLPRLKSYTPLEDASPLVLPGMLSNTTKSASTRFANVHNGSIPSKVTSDGKLDVTIDALRSTGRAADTLDASIRTLIAAANQIQERLELHMRELPRQQGKFRDIDDKLREMDSIFTENYAERIKIVRSFQTKLDHRADRLLQRLIDASQPELSSFELRWLDELDRIQKTVAGDMRKQSNSGLDARVKRLKEQMDTLHPQVREHDLCSSSAQQARIGQSQKQNIEAALLHE